MALSAINGNGKGASMAKAPRCQRPFNVKTLSTAKACQKQIKDLQWQRPLEDKSRSMAKSLRRQIKALSMMAKAETFEGKE
jgi:hypothetical protein